MADTNPITANFGEGAYVVRRPQGFAVLSADASPPPTYTDDTGWTRYEGTTTPVDASYGYMTWTYDPDTGSFVERPGRRMTGYGEPTGRVVSARALGLDPATAGVDIAGLASQYGANRDSWSQYAYTHGDTSATPGSKEWYDYHRSGIIGDWSKITGYENKESGFDKFMENVGVPLVTSVMLGGFASAALGALGSASAAATTASAGSAAAEGVATAAGGAAEGATSGIIAEQAAAPVVTATTTSVAPSFETVLTQAGISAAKNAAIQLALTGKVNPAGVVASGLGGGFGTYVEGAVNDVLPGATSGVKDAITAGTKGALSSGLTAAATGGDVGKAVLTGGATGAAGTAVKEFVGGYTDSNTVSGGFAGVVSGALGAAINGGDVAKGAIRGGVTGAATGAAQDMGASPTTAGIIGSLVGSALTKNDQTLNAIAAPTTPAASTANSTSSAGLVGFASAVPVEYHPITRAPMNWGSRGNWGA